VIYEIKAPGKPERSYYAYNVFLAGGITGCRNWQRAVIAYLKYFDGIYKFGNIAVFNPRRDDFDVSDSEETIEQIRWEHKYLKQCDLFTVFFSSSDSVQPISLYEMGKHVAKKPSVITIEKGYLREEDVLIQTALDGLYCGHYNKDVAAYEHARAIAHGIDQLRRNK
jgi:hypothetical protein